LRLGRDGQCNESEGQCREKRVRGFRDHGLDLIRFHRDFSSDSRSGEGCY
jgi:hypothetical protein